MNAERRWQLEKWIAWVRLGAIPFAVVQVELSTGYPPGRLTEARIVTLSLAVGGLLIFWLVRRSWSETAQARIGLAALVFDFAIVSAYILVFSYERGTPVREIMLLPLVEAALRYGIRGALAVVVASVPVLAFFERLRSHRYPPVDFHTDFVTLQIGIELLLGLIVGWLVLLLLRQTSIAETRAAEAERLRDELGRRADVLEAANRCARALGSSLELEEAFDAFINEVRVLLPFDRISIVLAEDGLAHVMAVGGEGASTVLPPDSAQPIHGSVLEQVMRTSEAVYRRDMSGAEYDGEDKLLALGLHSRLGTPILLGPQAIGMIALSRREVDAFSPEEIELAGLLGRLVASAVQNIRAYDAERRTVEELRRLSALRADFVSLVSHELRTPMAAVIGSARTLQQRWRELTPDQRESFLGLIADETERLASLVGDVLDTSRIDAGTFNIRFGDVDLGELVRDTVALAELSSDEVGLRAEVHDPLPQVRGDAERLRQVLFNLIDNAIKYSPAGDEVEVRAYSEADRVLIDIRDHGPGIAPEDQRLIFEKFGRVTSGNTRPGTGLGLFIARSIAEAHGGTLAVSSVPRRGSTFTLDLPRQG